ncbi:MAG TPA: hypothetical protein VNB06_01040 [Thermoanaerobaculia bacterium]|nr:hypothetical protein [Thermoanaerobaculia bacterium]
MAKWTPDPTFYPSAKIPEILKGFKAVHPHMERRYLVVPVWSFLMATAHGAGLMVLPVVLASAAPASATESEGRLAGDSALASVAAPHCHATLVGDGAIRSDRDALGGLRGAIAATAVHGAGYLLVTALLAWVVFEKVGVGILRRAWLNLDQVWALALIATGALTALL